MYECKHTYQGEEFQGEILVRHRRIGQDQGELFHLPHCGRIVGQFGRVGSGAGAARSVATGAHRGASSPLTEGAVSAAAASAATRPILLSTVVLVAHRIMTAQSRLLFARGLQPEKSTKNLIQPGQCVTLQGAPPRNFSRLEPGESITPDRSRRICLIDHHEDHFRDPIATIRVTPKWKTHRLRAREGCLLLFALSRVNPRFST